MFGRPVILDFLWVLVFILAHVFLNFSSSYFSLTRRARHFSHFLFEQLKVIYIFITFVSLWLWFFSPSLHNVSGRYRSFTGVWMFPLPPFSTWLTLSLSSSLHIIQFMQIYHSAFQLWIVSFPFLFRIGFFFVSHIHEKIRMNVVHVLSRCFNKFQFSKHLSNLAVVLCCI